MPNHNYLNPHLSSLKLKYERHVEYGNLAYEKWEKNKQNKSYYLKLYAFHVVLSLRIIGKMYQYCIHVPDDLCVQEMAITSQVGHSVQHALLWSIHEIGGPLLTQVQNITDEELNLYQNDEWLQSVLSILEPELDYEDVVLGYDISGLSSLEPSEASSTEDPAHVLSNADTSGLVFTVNNVSLGDDYQDIVSTATTEAEVEAQIVCIMAGFHSMYGNETLDA